MWGTLTYHAVGHVTVRYIQYALWTSQGLLSGFVMKQSCG